jgi:hypothetical protein
MVEFTGHIYYWLVESALVANSLCLRQEKHMMCEREV